MTEYKNYPLAECIAAVQQILRTSPPGTAIYQKWTCIGCGERVTGNTPNELFELGHHQDCGRITNIRETGCNYSVHMAIGGLASQQPKGTA
jgi:hypothetical protein